MYKLVAFTTLLAVAAAAPGFIGAPIAAAPIAPWGHGIVSAPLVSTGVVKTAVPVATSYANTVKLASPTVVAASAPYVAASAPYVAASAPYVAAPAPYVAAHAPLVAAHAPIVSPALAHAW